VNFLCELFYLFLLSESGGMRKFDPERVFCQTDGKATLFGAICLNLDGQDLLDEQDILFGSFLDLVGVGKIDWLLFCG
jgi:hypothetical protein